LKHVLLEVNKAVKTGAAIIDGKFGLNINGPMVGTPVRLDWVLVANDPGTGARLACELMQVPLDKVPHLRYLAEKGLIPHLKDITTNQKIEKFRRDRFVLQRKWTDYPGLFAFKSPAIAYLAYFSPLAGFLHRLLYLVRKPLYNYEKYAGKD